MPVKFTGSRPVMVTFAPVAVNVSGPAVPLTVN